MKATISGNRTPTFIQNIHSCEGMASIVRGVRDRLQPFKTQDVLWVLRDTLSGELLLARSLDSARQDDLVALLRVVKDALPVPASRSVA